MRSPPYKKPPGVATPSGLNIVHFSRPDNQEDKQSSNIFQLPSPIVDVEPGHFHGWDIVARQSGRLVFHKTSVALLSVAQDEAARLSGERNWRMAA